MAGEESIWDKLGDTVVNVGGTYASKYIEQDLNEKFSNPAPVASPEPYATRETDTSLTETPKTDKEVIIMVVGGLVIGGLVLALVAGRR